MSRLLMLDSGAFSVWNSGSTIDFEEYISFCKRRPHCSYYVNLDVIPGVPGNKRSLTKDSIEASCKAGWQNYRRMIEKLPMDKVIPVYHQNDPIRWLDKYLAFGVKYIGISPANDNATSGKLKWMSTLRKTLFSNGEPVVRTHGFAVTSYDLMRYWQWHSVDSASWKLTAAWGQIYIPRKTAGRYDYTKPPLQVAVSPNSPSLGKRQFHLGNLTPTVRTMVEEYLDHTSIASGTSTISAPMPEGHKLSREHEETWFDKKKRTVIRPVVKGVTNSFGERCRINLMFIKEMEKVLPVDHIYCAGAPVPIPRDLEDDIHTRLLSYHEVGRGDNKYLNRHMELIRDEKRSSARTKTDD